METSCFLRWAWIRKSLLELLVAKEGPTLPGPTFLRPICFKSSWLCCSLRVILCVNMVPSAHESLKHNRSYSFSLSPLNTHNLGNTFQLSHCQNNVIVSPNVIRTQFIQTWAKSEAVLHSSFFLIIKGFGMPSPPHQPWLSRSLTGFNWKRESVHFWASSWSALITECVDLIWSWAKDPSPVPPSLCLCWSVFLSACLSFYLSLA